MTGARPVGYYVHHHGAGHGALALATSRRLGERLVGLGSGGPPAGWAGRWVDLVRDDDPRPAGDPTLGGAWHWAPTGHLGFGDRMTAIARWVADTCPAALVVDVSCEVAALGVLLGVPTLPVMLHGRRDDRPHRTTWDGAAAIVAPWPASHAEGWQRPWSAVTTHLGLTSRFDDRTTPAAPEGREVVVLLPAGGHAITLDDVDAAAGATAADGWTWTVLGGPAGRVADPWPTLVGARVVVAAAGAGSVADIAAARRPAVLLPQDRPFAEQRSLAGHLAATGAPVVVPRSWPTAEEWPTVLARAAALDPEAWSSSHDRRGADRLAEAVDRVAA